MELLNLEQIIKNDSSMRYPNKLLTIIDTNIIYPRNVAQFLSIKMYKEGIDVEFNKLNSFYNYFTDIFKQYSSLILTNEILEEFKECKKKFRSFLKKMERLNKGINQNSMWGKYQSGEFENNINLDVVHQSKKNFCSLFNVMGRSVYRVKHPQMYELIFNNTLKFAEDSGLCIGNVDINKKKTKKMADESIVALAVYLTLFENTSLNIISNDNEISQLLKYTLEKTNTLLNYDKQSDAGIIQVFKTREILSPGANIYFRNEKYHVQRSDLEDVKK